MKRARKNSLTVSHTLIARYYARREELLFLLCALFFLSRPQTLLGCVAWKHRAWTSQYGILFFIWLFTMARAWNNEALRVTGT